MLRTLFSKQCLTSTHSLRKSQILPYQIRSSKISNNLLSSSRSLVSSPKINGLIASSISSTSLLTFSKAGPLHMQRELSYSSLVSRFSRNNDDYDSDAFFPNGILRSLIIPTVFALGVGGAALYLVNDDTFRDYRRRQQHEAALKTQKAPYSPWTHWYYSMDAGQMLMYELIAVNTAIFLAWQVVPKSPMYTWFTHSITNGRSLPMLLSCFSHQSVGHFLFNMFAFWSFGNTVIVSAGRDQLLAMYVAGGLFSSWVSHVFKLAVRDFHPSLGASGAVFSFVALTTYLYPDARFNIIFLPFFSFAAKSMLPCLVAFDVVGAFGRTFRLFNIGLDHAAHLGGVGFGWYYTKYLKDKRDRRMAALRKAGY